MQPNLRVHTLTLIIVALGWMNVSAQTNIYFTSYFIRDDNAFKSREAYEEWINNSTLHLGYRFVGNTYQFQGYYSTDFLTFANNGGLNNYAHKFGVSGRLDNDEYTISIHSFARLHNYKEPYIYYNVNRYFLNASFQYNPNLKHIYSLGLTVNKDRYSEFEELDNLIYRIYVRFQRFFQSKISITGEAGLGIKNYVNQSVIQYFGVGLGPRSFTRDREDPVRATIFSLSAIIGKSITSHLGVSLGLGGQWFVGDPIMAYSNGIYYYTENDLYDDPYSYQNHYITLHLTKQFAVGFQGKIGVKYQSKDYAGTPAIGDDGNVTDETREDSRSEYFIMITKKFETGWRFPGSIDLFFNFMYRNNPSNDPYYDYEDHIGLLGFSVGL